MELRIKPFPKNTYPKKAIFIKGASPSTWLYEMEALEINITQVRTFAIPSAEPNLLYGCLVVFSDQAPQAIGQNSYFQSVDDRLFIPENTIFYPKVQQEDWQNIDAEFLIMHPEFGLVKLSEPINWISLLEEPEKAGFTVRKPLNGVTIPKKIERYVVDMDDEKVIEGLQKSQKEEEWMKNLPFDMKKVMAGNKKEIEKYLKYIEKYPDRAVDLGVPLDIMGTSRGDGFGRFRFNNSWLGRLFGGNTGTRDYRWVLWAFWIVIIIGRVVIGFTGSQAEKNTDAVSSGKVISQDMLKNQQPKKLAFESGLTEIDMKIDSLYQGERRALMNEYAAASKDPKTEKLAEVEKKVEQYRTKENQTRDFLKKIYKKKIEKHIEDKSKAVHRKISDSLKKANPNKPLNNGIVKSIWRKKQVLMQDSLGRLYGTIDQIDSNLSNNRNTNTQKTQGSGNSDSEKISFSEIILLILLIVGGVGLYSYFFRKRSLNVGGSNVPNGIKIFLVIVLVAMLIYLFYPLIEMFGYNWFVWIFIVCVVFLVYRLFSEDKTILKSDEDE
ncbi:hypothetical protein IQ37_04630 [Chryseobacterium piperi]|uniref:MoxR-vWA-beta-propeller ternary system domain-containing protein n=1 Tax=Chryseobacterium piperi TaxID=558152 RepID=A0A086BL85_9FLAO|nr:hypothetical protein [Chryseobacterium piperi]ASW74662.1 hypothetical protein CJF12_10450 [Chryseobacterium piperi]KFF29699.1 hypothetical protein IQ37_04630 [Chryseobacterium piperi]